jgi:hypothetical protein
MQRITFVKLSLRDFKFALPVLIPVVLVSIPFLAIASRNPEFASKALIMPVFMLALTIVFVVGNLIVQFRAERRIAGEVETFLSEGI